MLRESDRFIKAIDMISDNQYQTILDIGCRDKALKKYLKEDILYQGIDFKDDDEVLAHNLEEGIPFSDDSFDIVFALDVLEHVENIHFLFSEILRVSKKEAIVALPNMSYWKFRLRYLKGNDISDKYVLPPKMILDRHRWLTSYKSSKFLIQSLSGNFNIVEKKYYYQYNSKVLKWIDFKLSKKFPNIFVYATLFKITKYE
jgi:SAM-dependent methyltransferase|tara:strand:+ start:921 stop:1523 length:603 start_codon:yes stop_codon:yes gene_type:complete